MRPSRLLPVALALALAAPGGRSAAAGKVRPSAPAAAAPVGPRDPAAEAFARASAALARDRRGPEGLAAVGALAELEDEAPDLSRLATAYARAADDATTHPEVRAALRLRLAEVERARGNLRRSDAQLARLGFVHGWQLAGPFDDEGKRGFGTAYPPEQALLEGGRGADLEARYPGKVRDVGWRALPADGQGGGLVHVGAALRPSREVVAYALAVVSAPRDERVQLWLGASGAAKVWVNGALALSDPTYHPARLDQHGATVTVRRGANRILVKLCQQDGRMGFFLRLADARGEGVSFPAGDPAAAPAQPGPPPARIDDATVVLTRRAAAARGKQAGPAQAALAAVLALRAAGDRDERLAAAAAGRAAKLLPGAIEAQLAAAALEEDHAARRVILDGALAAAPGDARVLRAVAQDELDQGRPQAAARLLQRAVEAAPEWAEARVAQAEALDRSGLAARAALLAEDTVRRFPTSPAAVRAGAHAADRLGRVAEAAARERTLLALRFDDEAARAGLVQHLLQLGDAAAAAALLAEGLRLEPADLFQRLAEADLLAANGHPEAAEASYARALALCPEEPDAWERRGRARLAAGRARDAQADLSRALELKPQSTGLKELVRSLSPAAERFEAPYVLDARALVAAAATAPAAAWVGEDAVVLADLKVTRVLPSGLSSTYTQRLVKVLTARGADAFRRQGLTWTPDRQEVRVEQARIWKPDGAVVEGHEEQEESASEPWYRLYYDLLARTLTFPALAAGDVLEVAWRVDDTAGENLLSDYFGDVTLVDEAQPKARFDYVLVVPAARAIHASAPPGVAHVERPLEGGLVEHRFTARELPRLAPEPAMPGQAEVARFVHVSTYASWDEVNRFYWRLVRDQLRAGPELQAVADRIADGVRPGKAAAPAPTDPETRAALVRAAHAFVVTQTRYVGLEFGIHGFKPYRVDQVLARRFGDCKDKASLLHALLGELGIDSRLVLLRMRRLGRIPEAPASLAVFNHAIVYVPELDLWLDGTASYSGTRELPQEDRGATVLVVNPDGPPRFGTIPDASPDDNRLAVELRATLAADGSASAEGAWTVAGVDAPAYRRAYGIASERRAELEQALNRSFPGVKVESERTSDLSRLEDDVAVRYTLAVPRLAQPDGDGLRFLPFGSVRGYAEAYAPLSTRKHDLDLGSPRTLELSYRTALPPGWRLAEVPEPAERSGPGARFSVRYRAEGGALLAEGRVVLTASRVARADYPAFREIMVALDRALARRVRVGPPAGAAAGGAGAARPARGGGAAR